jgi:RNA polymerase sigma factor (sigma-70 family)
MMLGGEGNMEIDKAFVRALQNNNEDAWEKLYNEALAPLRRQIAMRYNSLSPAEVDDIWARVIERVYTKIHTLRKPGSLRAWLWSIARNAATNYLRDNQVHVPIDDRVATSHDGQGQQRDKLEQLRQVLASAPPPHAAVLLAKIGQETEVPDGVVYLLTGLKPSEQWGTIGGLRRRTAPAP